MEEKLKVSKILCPKSIESVTLDLLTNGIRKKLSKSRLFVSQGTSASHQVSFMV